MFIYASPWLLSNSTLNAECMEFLMQKKLRKVIHMTLNEFKISVKQIYAIATDGAAMNLKLGGLLEEPLSLCLCHALHLSLDKTLSSFIQNSDDR